LAEAEIEYEDITSTQVDVAFEIIKCPVAVLVGARAVVWTTTPWTIPVNQAIAYGPDIDYVAVETTGGDAGGYYLVAAPLLEQFLARAGLAGEEKWRGKGSELAGTLARHPMHELGAFFATPRPF